MRRKLMAAGIVLSMLAAFGAHAFASTVVQGVILVGTGGGCAKSPDCTLFRVTCDPAIAPLNGTTAAVLDVKAYRGRTIRVTAGSALLSTGESGVIVEGMSEDCSQLTAAATASGNHPLSIVATFRYVIVTAPLGAVGMSYTVEAL